MVFLHMPPSSRKYLIQRHDLPTIFGAGTFAVLAALLSGCASGSAARVVAQQNEAAQLRQQAEEKPVTPDNKGMYLSLIRQMQEHGMYFASLAHIDAYEQQNGSAPEVLRLRADALRETRQTVEADVAYRQLLNSSEAGAAWHGLGLMAAQNGDDIAAAKLLREAVKSEPTNPVLLSDLGYALLRGGDISGARVPLAQAAELAPDNRKMIGNLALLLLVSGDREKANAIMDKATLSADSRATVYRLAAEIGQRQHQSGAVASQHVAGGNKPAAAGVATPASTSASPVTMRVTPFQSMLSRFGNGG